MKLKVYVNNLACVRMKGGESKCFRIESSVKQGCNMSPWLFNVYMNAVMEEMEVGMGRMEHFVEVLGEEV